MKNNKHGGFTLLELLIVIAIIAILSVALIIVINPAETLKKSRDAQRISDLSTLKTALGIMLTSTSTPSLDGLFGATNATTICTTGTTGTVGTTGPKIRYSLTGVSALGVAAAAGTDSALVTWPTTAGSGSSSANVDGTGWIPAVLTNLVGGSPISNYPLDPSNTVASLASPASTDLVYRYACQNGGASGKPGFVFEVDTTMESTAYGVGGADDKSAKDGGDNTAYYEVGNSLRLLPTTSGF